MSYTPTHFQRIIKPYVISLNVYPTFFLATSLDLVSSTVSEQPVSFHAIFMEKLTSFCALDPLFYDVYTRISEIHLEQIGLNVSWTDVDVTDDDDEKRWLRSREYFSLPLYHLPVVKLRSQEE